jgi:hypothetical protein
MSDTGTSLRLEERTMAIYRMNDAALELPEDWEDKSVNVFATSLSDPFPISLVINRDRMKPGQSLADFAEQRLDEMESMLKQFTMVERRQLEIAGTTALEAEFKWRSDAGLMHQKQTFIPRGERVLVVTVTVPRELREQQRTQIELILSSLQLE